MARILLGVSGGIAAYKSLEFTRLAIKAGHSVRVVQTPDSHNFVGKSSFEGITGAPVLTNQFETDPAGGAFPGSGAPGARSDLRTSSSSPTATSSSIAPATANTIAKITAAWPTTWSPRSRSAVASRCSSPRR